jgi:hypothetical protein
MSKTIQLPLANGQTLAYGKYLKICAHYEKLLTVGSKSKSTEGGRTLKNIDPLDEIGEMPVEIQAQFYVKDLRNESPPQKRDSLKALRTCDLMIWLENMIYWFLRSSMAINLKLQSIVVGAQRH